MSVFVYSTLTGSHKYPIYRKRREGGDTIPQMESYVLIHGGANLATKHLITPKGVVTKVTDDEYERLKANPAFARHLKRGYLTVEDYDYTVDEIVADMTPKDGSAPLTPDDYGNDAPTTAEAKPESVAQTDVRPNRSPGAPEAPAAPEAALTAPAAPGAPVDPVASSESSVPTTDDDDAAGFSETQEEPEKPTKRRRRPKKDK